MKKINKIVQKALNELDILDLMELDIQPFVEVIYDKVEFEIKNIDGLLEGEIDRDRQNYLLYCKDKLRHFKNELVYLSQFMHFEINNK